MTRATADDVTTRFRIGIVGHGFVGQAVEYAFMHPLVDFNYYDPKYETTLDTLTDAPADIHPKCFFICAPTPSADDGSVDSSIVEASVLKCLNYTDALVVVKSTITPESIDRLYSGMSREQIDRFVYNPEFLTEKNAKADFVGAKFHVIGGMPVAARELIDVYEIFGACESNDYHRMTAYEASFVKYTINSYLSTKITFFNQLYDLVNMYGCNYNTIVRAVGKDDRVGVGHTRVPGFDGKRGFGGACLPKDTRAFLDFSTHEFADGTTTSFDLLEKVLDINSTYRVQYTLDEREKVNNITFVNFGGKNVNNGQTKEELEDQRDSDLIDE
jgi:UDPglucose 6-dehydrogenase|tara:strand:- start:338 stop:1324 length:987 start_codon:yes stop_codon:yes gene_type:complete